MTQAELASAVGTTQTRDLKFTRGTFALEGGQFEIKVDLEIYPDGIVATSRSTTANNDVFISDVLEFLDGTFHLANEAYILKTKRSYRSDLVLHAPEITIGRSPGALMSFREQLAEGLNVPAVEIEPHGITFSSESRGVLFTFERRANVPFAEHKYYSSALMQTHAHWNVLQQLSVVLKAD
jgi:hypothetical protein